MTKNPTFSLLAVFVIILAATRATRAETPCKDLEDLLNLMEIGPKNLTELPDDEPFDENNQSLVARVLLRLDDVDQALIAQCARSADDVRSIAAEPAAARGRFFRLAGRITSLQTVELPDPDARRFMFTRYYRAEMRIEEAANPNMPGSRVVILTRRLPHAWLQQESLNARASCFGLFLYREPGSDGEKEPVFAAPRIAWHPHTPLGELGMDVGLFEGLRDRQKIGAEQRECFYQMLAAVGRTKPGQLLRMAREELRKDSKAHFSVVPLFNSPETQRGRLVVLSGTARRVVEVRVQDPDIVARFGIDHYYEVYLFTPDSQGNPLVFCVRRLPAGMPVGGGPQYAEQVEVAGFFLQTWRYRPLLAEKPSDADKRQLAPLLIGREPQWLRTSSAADKAESTWVGAIVGGLFIVVLAVIWLAVWRADRGDRRWREARRHD